MSARRFSGRGRPVSGLRALFGNKHNDMCHSLPDDIDLPENGKKVLVVDDDAVILKTTAMKLQAHGYKVTIAKDAPSAIKAARDERPDLILMDISFPPDFGSIAWDGFLIMSWLRRVQETRDIPVIVMSGGQTGNPRDRAAVNGAVAFFPKPLDHQALLSVIERVAGKQPGTPNPPPPGEEFNI